MRQRLAVLYILLASASISFAQAVGGNGAPGANSGGGVSGLTPGYVPKAATSTSVGNSHMDDGVTTASTMTVSEAFSVTGTLSATGGISSASDGVHPGLLALPWNSTVNPAPTNATGWEGSVAASGTSGWFDIPAALPTVLSLMEFGAASNSHAIGSNVAPTALTTTANCLAATSPVTTPCIAAQGGATALGNSGTSGTVTLYTSSAPAGMFTVCPVVWVATSAGTGPGNITLALTYTSPGSLGISAYTVNTTAITAYDGFNTCNTVATKSGTTFSFVIAASGASGTASSWEYSYVVTRLE